ncbi:hypothetical protein NHX12_026086 [Muraenolepis orangiensis]|uniref:NF-kappa-B inhibitor epsilon n=1 Tax=Muraenolepis orangiensis TaxID=630683 RepID=A0A9Q0IQF6_9TELE|nr:hypothetical protein NHX12_026086 [Muraenolepis orangiensis]
MASGDYKKDDRMDDNRTDSGIDSYRSVSKDAEDDDDDDGVGGGGGVSCRKGADGKCGGADERLDSAYDSASLTEDGLLERVEDGLLGRVEDCRISTAADYNDEPAATGTTPPAPPGLDEQEEHFLTTITEDGDTILHLAIIHEDEHFAHQLIQWFPKDVLDIQNNLYQTPLHLATYLSLPSTVQSLVEKGASLEPQDRDGNTPLHVACQHGWIDCAASMTWGVSPGKLTPVLETQNWKGLACLHVATVNGHHQLVKLLVKKGADLNIQEGTSGKTALHLAVERHDVSLVVLLLQQQSADVDAAMFNGCTPLHLAVGRQDATIAHLLCQADADKMVRNTENETPLDLADGNDDILALFPFDDIQISGRSVVGMKF